MRKLEISATVDAAEFSCGCKCSFLNNTLTMLKYFVWFSLFTCSLCRLTEFYRWKQMKYQHLGKLMAMII